MNRLTQFVRLAFVALLLPLSAHAGALYQADVDYEVLPQPVRTANPAMVEVNEIFSYHCSHCFDFESPMHEWVKTLPEGVDLQRTPAPWQPALEPLARAYYSAVALGVLEQTHIAIFEAYHIKKSIVLGAGRLDADDFAEIFAAAGVSADKLASVFNSFGVTSLVNQAKSRIRAYRTQGTPEVVVNGKYRVTLQKTKSFDGMLAVARFLVDKELDAQNSARQQ
jgi:protein dithiol oxidoreductase (disulfide-forming)